MTVRHGSMGPEKLFDDTVLIIGSREVFYNLQRLLVKRSSSPENRKIPIVLVPVSLDTIELKNLCRRGLENVLVVLSMIRLKVTPLGARKLSITACSWKSLT